MKDKQFVEIDALPWMTKGCNIEVSVFLGKDASEPCYENIVSLIELIDQELNSYTVPYSEKIVEHHFEDVEKLMKNLKSAYKYAKKRAKEMGYEQTR